MTAHPSKTCVSCGRTIDWRRKWERDWDRVRYCSAACRRRKVNDLDATLEAALQAALDRRGASVDPLAIAHQVGGEHWAELVEPARRAARRLVAGGNFEILADGRVADPSTARGSIRLRRTQ